MKSKKESDFWKDIRDQLRLEMISRVENKVDVGWPDVHYLHNKKAGWIELKVEKKFPKRIAFEPAQPLWLDNYTRLGGTAYVFLLVEDEGVVYVWDGKHAMDLNKDASKVKPRMKILADQEGFEYLYLVLFL